MTTAGGPAANGRPPVAAKTELPSKRSCKGLAGFLGNAQSLIEIVDDVAGRLQADRKAHQILPYARGLEGRTIHLGMGGARRMDHQRLGVAHIGEMRGK